MIKPKPLLKMKLLWLHRVFCICQSIQLFPLLLGWSHITYITSHVQDTQFHEHYFVAMLSIFCAVGHSRGTVGRHTPKAREREGEDVDNYTIVIFRGLKGFMKRGIPCALIILSGILWRRYVSSDTSLDRPQKKSSHLSINVFSDFGASFAILGIGCVFQTGIKVDVAGIAMYGQRGACDNQ